MPDKESLPTIKVVFDPATQVVTLNFDPAEFKTWDFVVGILDIAKQQAEFNRNLSRMQAMQQQQVEAANAVQLRNKLKI